VADGRKEGNERGLLAKDASGFIFPAWEVLLRERRKGLRNKK